ncbi:SRPBCC domain-containing protein [Flavobacterium beibuense]|uniref:Activator of Hsp90 ATPase 1 family protein n=1 Tax=Flavobacterium beibuense TaxID=657326 RepID=A0A444WEY9_9FLAO|nr:SRPBCC domain-containing protein [Flavobacterium beibuense]RYJ44420.1 Activator of Hsp90 ATPase 1 family protein [Flavobacterium beibuense]
MSKSLIVKNNIRIDAPLERVWEVLTKPKYIRQWDQLPEDFGDFEIHPATVIEWPGYSKLSVVEFVPNQMLRYELYVPTWEERVTNIGYTYTLTVDNEDHTWLGVEIGDFAILTDGDKYFDSSVDFEKTASQKIKELAERREIAL